MITLPFSYYSLEKYRLEIGVNFRELPVIYKRDSLILKRILAVDRVLDVGAGGKALRDQLQTAGFQGVYRSMDTDRSGQHDYYDLADVKETFDVVVMREVIEHISLPAFLDSLPHLVRILLPRRGSLILTTPNVFSSWQMCDITHIQHYPYYDLYALLRYGGFERVSVFRCAHGGKLLMLKRFYRWIHLKCFDTDFAGAILMVGEVNKSVL